jgi:hypothetical protein
MTATASTQRPAGTPGRPPKAVVGSQVNQEEKIFGEAFNGHVIRRFFGYLRPYRTRLLVAVAAVLVFTVTATDAEDGVLPARSYSWSVNFLHAGHVHPALRLAGVTGGRFVVPS